MMKNFFDSVMDPVLVAIAAMLFCGNVSAENLFLRQAVDIALKNSPDVDIAELEEMKAQYQLNASTAEMLPKVDGFIRYSSDDYVSDSTNKGWLISGGVVQPVWKAGKLFYTRQFYKNLKDAAVIQLEKKKLDVAYEVKKAFFDVYKFSELLKVADETKDLLASHYGNVNKMYVQRIVPKVDVLRTKSRLDEAQLEHIEILNELYLAKNRLNYLLDVPLDYDYEIVYSESNMDLKFTLDELMQVAFERSPEVILQDYAEQNARLNTKISRADLFPQIDAYARIGRLLRTDYGDDTEKSAGFTANMDIWDWGKNYSEMKASDVNYQQELRKRRLLNNRLTLDVRNAYIDYDISLKRINAAARVLESSKEELKKQLIRFKNGQATNQEILDAEVFHTKAGYELKRAYAFSGEKKGFLERVVGIINFEEIEEKPRVFENDMDFISYVEYRAFLYFMEEQSGRTGLFRDTSGGGDCSIAATGFGLAALCVGVENGWIEKDEAERKTIKCLKTLAGLNNRKDGFFFHFLQIDTGERSGNCEVSTVDTAILLCGVIAASEYFSGEVKELGYQIVGSVRWEEMFDKGAKRFCMGWTPEDGNIKYKWNFYTDEIFLMAILALGSTENIPEDVFYSFERKKMSGLNGEEFVVSWTGALFTYQYANIWFDLRDKTDAENINWYENSKKAVISQIAYCRENSPKYRSFGRTSWGISSCETKDGYTMAMGAPPCGELKPQFDGTVAITGSVGSIIFTPYESLNCAKYYYSQSDLWGRYGLKNAFNIDENWVSNTAYGIDRGLMLLAIENFRSELIWNLMMKSSVVQKGFERAGLK
ncbi:TolC family protein [bacterium]|jgi:outer membrane protein TolC|nr:TolC family protein [bacterium]